MAVMHKVKYDTELMSGSSLHNIFSKILQTIRIFSYSNELKQLVVLFINLIYFYEWFIIQAFVILGKYSSNASSQEHSEKHSFNYKICQDHEDLLVDACVCFIYGYFYLVSFYDVFYTKNNLGGHTCSCQSINFIRRVYITSKSAKRRKGLRRNSYFVKFIQAVFCVTLGFRHY